MTFYDSLHLYEVEQLLNQNVGFEKSVSKYGFLSGQLLCCCVAVLLCCCVAVLLCAVLLCCCVACSFSGLCG